jgi:hypothetical protein
VEKIFLVTANQKDWLDELSWGIIMNIKDMNIETYKDGVNNDSYL